MPSFAGQECKKAKRTKSHRPAMWECMLGTVYAMNEAGKVEYFDYDWAKAAKYAGISEDRDVRLANMTRDDRGFFRDDQTPRIGRPIVWIRKSQEVLDAAKKKAALRRKTIKAYEIMTWMEQYASREITPTKAKKDKVGAEAFDIYLSLDKTRLPSGFHQLYEDIFGK